MKKALLAGLLVSLFGCASSRVGIPEVELSQTTRVPSVKFNPDAGLPIEYQLKIVNQADHAITLTMVEMESIGGAGAYDLKRVRHSFNETIPAKSTRTVELRAWVHRLQQDIMGNSDNPVVLRGYARFDSMGDVVKTNFVARTQ